jgi:hypothetical protein
LEAIARRAAEITTHGETYEDDRVELKSVWPDPVTEMARQLAAQANSSGRQEFVWLIGIRQKVGVVGAPARDGAEWLPRLRPNFDDGVLPTLSAHLNLDSNGNNVVVLAWDPNEPPYVVKLDTGRARREVPWREGEMVRTAGRRDLLRILEPIALAPTLELVPNGLSWITANLVEEVGGLQWSLRCLVRVTPRSSRPVVIPYGTTTCKLLMGGADDVSLKLYMITNDGETPYRITGHGEVTFAGPATIEVMSDPLPTPSPVVARPETITAEFLFEAIGATREAKLTTHWKQPVDKRNDYLWGWWVPVAEAGLTHRYRP